MRSSGGFIYSWRKALTLSPNPNPNPNPSPSPNRNPNPNPNPNPYPNPNRNKALLHLGFSKPAINKLVEAAISRF